MFERYDESSRRALFFARYEVTQLGGLTIELEHLVLGILRESPSAILRFVNPDTTAGSIVSALARQAGEKVSTRVEVPFSGDCKAALERAAIEATDAGHRTIRCEHLLLGVLVNTSGHAARVLHGAGVRIEAVREHVTSSPAERPAGPAVSRQWKGVTKQGQEDAYIAHLEREVWPSVRGLAGFLQASILRRPIEGGTEFQIVTIWRSLDDIKAFAGDDVEAAVVPPAAQALLSSYDRRVVHYEVVNTRGTLS